MTTIEVTVDLLTPLLLGEHKQGNVYATQTHIPGAVLRGAIAQPYIEACPPRSHKCLHDHARCPEKCDFHRLFFAQPAPRFGPCYPAQARLSYPLPATAGSAAGRGRFPVRTAGYRWRYSPRRAAGTGRVGTGGPGPRAGTRLRAGANLFAISSGGGAKMNTQEGKETLWRLWIDDELDKAMSPLVRKAWSLVEDLFNTQPKHELERSQLSNLVAAGL